MQMQTKSVLKVAQALFIDVFHIRKLYFHIWWILTNGLNENQISMKRMCGDYNVSLRSCAQRVTDRCLAWKLVKPSLPWTYILRW